MADDRPEVLQSPAYAALPPNARRVFAAIARSIGDSRTVSVSYHSLRFGRGIEPKRVSPALRLLDHLGLIDIQVGPRLVNTFRLSDRWRSIDTVEAARLSALAREPKPPKVRPQKQV